MYKTIKVKATISISFFSKTIANLERTPSATPQYNNIAQNPYIKIGKNNEKKHTQQNHHIRADSSLGHWGLKCILVSEYG